MSRRALVLSLCPDDAGFRDWVRSHAGAIDWPWVIRRARAHKVAALLAARLEGCGLMPALDSEMQQQFQQVRHEARSQATIALHTLQRLAQAFDAANVPFFAVKGCVLAEHVYGNPAMRRFVDIDLVTRHEAIPQAEAVLRALGYRFGQVVELLGASPNGPVEWQAAEAITRRFYETSQYQLPLYPPRGGGGELLPVDLHWRVAPAARMNVTGAQLWEQTVPIVVGGTPIRTFNPAATLIHLAVHASTCTLSAFRLLHLCDVAWASVRWRDSADDLWRLAEAWGVKTHVSEVFETVSRVFEVPMPLVEDSPRSTSRSRWRDQLTVEFLVDAGRDSEWPAARKLWSELVWNLAMGCLESNVARIMRTRLARLRWAVWRWRGRQPPG